MYRSVFCRTALLLAVGWSLGWAALTAQAQTALMPEVPVSGEVIAAPVEYTFNGAAGEVVSVWVTATDAIFDPVLTLLEGERTLLRNDDYHFPDTRDALLEAVTLPRTGTYTARVEGYAGSSGTFTITLRRGFAGLGAIDDFGSSGGWATGADAVRINISGGDLLLSYTGQGTGGAGGVALLDAEYHARIRVTDVRTTLTNAGWVAGITAQYGDAGSYGLHIRGDGTYRFVRRDGDAETALRDWGSHPAIVPGQTAFTLAMLARNGGFHLFYNDSPLMTISDAGLAGEVVIGAAAGVIAPLPGEAEITFDDLTVTVPARAGDRPVIPDQVYVSDGQAMTTALTRRHVVDAGGELALTVPESSVQYARSGVNRLMLGGGTVYSDFMLGGTVELTQNSVGISGCGLVFRSSSEDDYALVFFDSTGGAGVSVQQNGQFQPGLFVEGLEVATVRHLLVIADGTTLYAYIDGRSIGTLTLAAGSGEVGSAVVNYDAVDTRCVVRNLWVWSWGG